MDQTYKPNQTDSYFINMDRDFDAKDREFKNTPRSFANTERGGSNRINGSAYQPRVDLQFSVDSFLAKSAADDDRIVDTLMADQLRELQERNEGLFNYYNQDQSTRAFYRRNHNITYEQSKTKFFVEIPREPISSQEYTFSPTYIFSQRQTPIKTKTSTSGSSFSPEHTNTRGQPEGSVSQEKYCRVNLLEGVVS